MAKVIISLGSNLGDSLTILKKAIVKINNQIGKVVCSSSFYQTKPWGFEAENEFVNAVVISESNKEPFSIMADLLRIEEEFGRTKSDNPGYTSRILDLDIIAIDEQLINSESLVIPHPHVSKRSFVLLPLAEVCPKWVHPLTKQGVMELIESLPDNGDIYKLEEN
jgi:2-amino-4-hydroxy-6-hydroxymethyldihydropteridine diphosphokinase